MTPKLDGIWAKIERASEHVNTLHHELNVFFETYAQRRVINYRFDGTWYIVSLSPPFDRPFPLRLSIICGDTVHNLRSALDHLVWQLVILEGGTPGMWTAFPIYDDATKFSTNVRFPKKRRSPLHGITRDREIWTLIENAQPYKRPNPRQDYLATLGKLSNIDKHRTLHAQVPLHDTESLWNAIGWNPDARLLEHKWSNPEISHEHETEILRLRFSQTGSEPQVHVKGNIGIKPTFGDGKTFQLSVGGIYQLPIWIRQLVEQFVKFF